MLNVEWGDASIQFNIRHSTLNITYFRMSWLQVTLETTRDEALRLGDALEEARAVSVSLEGADAEPLFETDWNDSTPVWRNTRVMTAFYMFRALFMTFFGESRVDHHVEHHIHESPKVMTVPLMVLAFLSIVGGYVGVPHVLGGANHIHEFLAPVVGGGAEPAKAHAAFSLISEAWAAGGGAGGHSAALEVFLMAVSVVIALSGIGIAYFLYLKNPALPKMLAEKWKGLYQLVSNKYYVDELYQALFVNSLKKLGMGLWKGFDELVIDGTVNGIAYFIGWLSGVMRKMQTGFVQNYAFSVVLGGLILVIYYMTRGFF